MNILLTLKWIKSPSHSLTAEFLGAMARIFHPDVFVETGTFMGCTTLEASRIFSSVHTVELSEELYRRAQPLFTECDNIHTYQGDSGKLFPELLETIEGKILFWLDGHYSEGVTAKSEKNSPILEELEAIKNAKISDAIILIDDLRMFPNSWTRIPEIASLQDYPKISQLLKAIRDISSAYSFIVFGDILLAYPPGETIIQSAVVKACTISRLCEGNDSDIEKVIDAEKIISNATGEELIAIQDLFAFLSPESAGLGEHYRLWYALTLMEQQQHTKACEQFQVILENGFNHWRIHWYLAQSAYQTDNIALARERINDVLEKNSDFRDAQTLLETIDMQNRTVCKKDDIPTRLHSCGLWRDGQPLRLHLGCGENHFDGYINIDFPLSEHSVQTKIAADLFADITLLDFPEQTVDEIRLHHVFEHFSRSKALALLIRWHSWLKIGGKLHIETPDVIGSARTLVADLPYRTKQGVLRHAFGSHEAPWAYHLDGWYKEKFEHILSKVGFSVQCNNVQWEGDPWLSNVHALAVKEKQIDRGTLLIIADDILLDSMVADVPGERLMHQVWCRMVRDELGKMLPDNGSTVPPEVGIAGITIENDAPGYDNIGYDNIEFKENGEFNVLSKIVQQKQALIIFDVGANKGYWSKLVLEMNPHATIYAFEPVPETFSLMQQNLKATNAHLHNLAISGNDGAKTFYHWDDSAQTGELSSFYRRPDVEKNMNASVKPITVQSYALDTFCREQSIREIDFLKIDTEGAELDVMRGAASLLSAKRIRILQFEYGGTYLDSGITLKQIYELLQRYGYSIFRVIPDGLLYVPRWRDVFENYRYANYIAVAPDMMNAFHGSQSAEKVPSFISGTKNHFPITTVVFSKDRAMQLDATLRSLQSHCTDAESMNVKIIYYTSTALHNDQYEELKHIYPSAQFIPEKNFKDDLLSALSHHEHVMFLVDDNLFVKNFKLVDAVLSLEQCPNAIGFSFRLGENTTYCYMLGKQQNLPAFGHLDKTILRYNWTTADLDFGYPLELSSSLYRVKDIMPLLERIDFKNPNTLELQLETNKAAYASAKPALLCFDQSVAFCNPVNRVQTMWANKAGKNDDYTAEKLSDLFAQGYRIDVARFSGFVPNSCHQEVAFEFTTAQAPDERSTGAALRCGAPFVTIGIANYNGIQHIQICLESIRRNTPEPHEVIVVDNGSTDGSREYLREQSDIILVENPENVGAPGARNQFLSIAKGDYVVFLDNDTLVTKNWIKNLVTHMESDPQIGIIGACTNYAIRLQGIPDVAYTNIEELEVYAEKRAQEHRGELLPSPRLISFCVFIRRAAIEKIGAMETGFSKFCFEDDDYAMRIHIAGFKSVVAHDVFIHHTGGPQGRGDNQYNKWLRDAWEGFKRKWGLAPNLPYGSSYDVGALVSQPFNPKRHYLPLPDPASVLKLVHHSPRGGMLPTTGQLSAETETQNGFDDVYKRESSPDVKTVRPEGSKEAKTSVGEDVTCSKIQFKKKAMSNMISIIIPVTGHAKQLKKCIENIRKYTPETHEIIFVENGCKAGTLKWIREAVKRKSNYSLIKVGKEAGQGKCFNKGMEASSGEHILLMSDHVIVADGWLDGMLECLNKADDTGIVGPMTNAKASGRQCAADSVHIGIDQLEKYAVEFRERNRHRRVSSRGITGFCMLFRRCLVEEIGSFDEELEQGSGSDDYCLRAALGGYKNLIAGDVFVLCGALPPKGNKRFFDYKWRDIDARSHDGERLGVLNAITDAEKLYQREAIDKAIVTLIDGIGYSPGEEAIYYRLAEMLIDCERFEEGLDAINSMPEGKEDSARTLELTGYCKAGLELYEEAAQCADRALSLNGSSASALNLMGVLAHGREDISASEDFFKRAISSDPGYGEAYTNLGVLEWGAGRKEGALENLEKGFILSPTAEDSRTAYLSAISETAQFERAECVFREAKTLYPENRRIAFLLIDILIRQEKKYDSAMQDIREAMITFGINDGILSAAQAVLDRFDAQETKDIEKKPALSLCMIVKDEENCLARCLMSAMPVVDEIIIVDTGSTDRTKEIAKTFGARVYDFEWTSDFSEARNVSLSKATSDWILVLDADETISALDYERLTKIVKSNSDHPAAYSINTRNYVKPPYVIGWTCNSGEYPDEEEGTGWYPSLKVRLFPNDSSIRFENPVHEFVESSLKTIGIEIRKSDIPVHHYGQLDREHYVAKGDKYYQLGKKKLEEKGEDLKALTELAVQAGGEFGKYEEAVDLWKRVLKIDPNNTKALVNLGGALLKLKKYEAARTSSEMAMTLAPDLKEAVIIYTTCEVLIGDAEKTIPILENLLKEVPGYPLAIAILAAAYGIEGERGKGMEQIKNLKKMGFRSAEYLHELSESLISSGKTDRAVSLLEFAVECGKGTRGIRELLDGLLVGD